MELQDKLDDLEKRLTILEVKSEERHCQSQDRHDKTYQKLDNLKEEIDHQNKFFDNKLNEIIEKIVQNKHEAIKETKEYVNGLHRTGMLIIGGIVTLVNFIIDIIKR